VGIFSINYNDSSLHSSSSETIMRTWILKQFGLVDAYKRIVELERIIIIQKEWLDRHESNLMILHKKTKALELEADILNKRSKK